MSKFIEVKAASTGKDCLINVERINYIYPALHNGRAYCMVSLVNGPDVLVDKTYEDLRDDIYEATK